jgi:hypothetical protein
MRGSPELLTGDLGYKLLLESASPIALPSIRPEPRLHAGFHSAPHPQIPSPQCGVTLVFTACWTILGQSQRITSPRPWEATNAI